MVPGNLCDRQVKILIDDIAVDERFVRGNRLAGQLYALLQRGDAVRRDAANRLVDTVGLQSAPQAEQLFDFLGRHFANPIAAVGEPCYVTFLGQARQRLADRRLADFQLQHQIFVRKPLAGNDFMLENRLFDFLVGDLGETKVFQACSLFERWPNVFCIASRCRTALHIK